MTKFPSYKVVGIEKLIPYARNARTHSDEQVAQIAASIKEFGFLNPIIIDGESGIVAGHGRVLAARKLGMKELPCVEAKHLTDAQRRAYILADNKLALNAGWDNELLRIEIESLGSENYNLALIGFSELELQGIRFDSEATVDFPTIAAGDKQPFQQMTFTLHDEQAAVVSDAITLARTRPESDTGVNENSNGNALALICGEWLSANA